MKKHLWHINILSIFMLGLDSKFTGEAFQPEFAVPLMNITLAVGRDATFQCLVNNLGGYRVGWVKADTKEIQAIHVHVITNNHRVTVSHSGQSHWYLHIKNLQEEDRGQYMCQINTDPMKSQMAYLNVVLPPEIIDEESSNDIMITEGSTAKLVCKARGSPAPQISWRREDGKDIVIRNSSSVKTKVAVFEEETLILTKISRSDMGAYLCIARNGLPPSVSKRIIVKVHFHPVIQVPNQLVGAPLGTEVLIECYVEASPSSINYWVRESNEMVISSSKLEVLHEKLSPFESRMMLTIKELGPKDLGAYRCIAKNSLGEVDSVIRVYEIPASSSKITNPINDHDIINLSEETFNEGNPTDQMTTEQENTTKNRSIFYSILNSVNNAKVTDQFSKIINEIKEETHNSALCIQGFVSLIITICMLIMVA